MTNMLNVSFKTENSINLFGFYKFMCTDILSSVYDAVNEEAEKQKEKLAKLHKEIDIAFPIVHGKGVEDGTLHSYLDFLVCF